MTAADGNMRSVDGGDISDRQLNDVTVSLCVCMCVCAYGCEHVCMCGYVCVHSYVLCMCMCTTHYLLSTCIHLYVCHSTNTYLSLCRRYAERRELVLPERKPGG